ncbi:MAG: hypothetical protein MUC42_17585 [Bryobacter sp.]|nr:hypothetical protein [Bryobacter sp.]
MQRRTFLSAGLGASLLSAPWDADLPDFSNCGYAGGGVRIPDLPIRHELKAESGDATDRIQAAIDKLALLPLEQRGAILLRRGSYQIAGTLRLHASGIVLRGEGQGERGTVLVAAGTKPRPLIQLSGAAPPKPLASAIRVADETVPVGARTLRLAAAPGFRPGQLVVVRRIGNAEWIHEIGMDRIKPRPGNEASTRQWQPFNLDFERLITAVDGDRIHFDAPILCAIERRWGGGEVFPAGDSARIRNSGVEELRGVSAFDRTVTAVHGKEKETYFSDENHATDLILLDNAADCWVRHVTALHFVGSCTELRRTRQVTIEDCHCGEMVSQITGGRRYPYAVSGQLTLVQRCTGDTGRHDFAVGSRVCGPNVFFDCQAGRAFATSEPHHRWSVGGLYDNVKADIAVQDRQYMGSGHGWAGANYVLWNCEGSLVCQKPPTADNWAIGRKM